MAEKKKGLFSKKPSAPAEMKPTPRKQLPGYLADALINARNFADRARVPESVPLIGGQGLGSMFLGQAPEEINELSYGNSPIQMNPYAGRTGSYVPEMKRGRGAQVFDALSLLSLPGARTVAGGLFGGGLTPGVDAAATVYHGSPFKFDRFDSSKIGTGEGAQAYGHGLYLADSEKVADSYRYVHGGGMPTVDAVSIGGKVISGLSTPSRRHGLGLTPSRAAAELPNLSREQARALSILEGVKGDAAKALSIAANTGNNRLYAAVEEFAPQFKVLEMSGPDTSLYKVDLPDEAIAKMLDYDKPINQQSPYVKDALERAGINSESSALAGPMAAGQETHLQKFGIPGIRYLDGGSRGAGSGTSNYVVFPGNESLLTILERNGQVAAPTYRDPFGNTLDETIR